MKLTAEEFVIQWADAAARGLSVFDFAAELGLSFQSVYQRAKRLRDKGVHLPPLHDSVRIPANRARDLNRLLQGTRKALPTTQSVVKT